ncbi:MAG TPA: prephenate dehydratase [Candidatus Binatia bacterium]|nr:prephenate dehydratase [Candidatus Binatia bacterium]
MSRKESVDALRKKIDQIDEKLVALLNDRASLAIRIGHHKRLNNEVIYAPSREQAILHRVAQLSRGPLPQQAIRSVFREVIGACRSLESPLKVAFFGAEATYSHLAAREKFGSTASLIPTSSINEVFHEVRQGRVSFGVVPIENSTEGVVAHTLDLLVDSDLRICAEAFLEIHHSLLSRTGRAEDLERIVSHPQALGQCRRWLAAHFPEVAVEEVASTAHAAMMAAADVKLGAISSSLAQEVYGLRMVAENIEDQSNNITRFLIIGRDDSRPSGDDKTSLVFSVQDRPGILHRMLEPFAKSRINLTKIESRPLKNKPWEYMFFIDFKGHREESGIRRAIKRLEKSCLFLKILGSYPSGV